MDNSKSSLSKTFTFLFKILTYGYGQTNVSGVISSKTNRTVSNSSNNIVDDVGVPLGYTLTIEPDQPDRYWIGLV
jgi:hypothetical protein